MLFKNSVKHGFGIKSSIKKDSKNIFFLIRGVLQILLCLSHPVTVHKVVEIYSYGLVDNLRKIPGRDRDFSAQPI